MLFSQRGKIDEFCLGDILIGQPVFTEHDLDHIELCAVRINLLPDFGRQFFIYRIVADDA